MTVSTHVLDTERGMPAAGVRVELWRGDELVGSGETDADGRIRQLADTDPGTYRIVFFPASPFFRRVELEVDLGRRAPPRSAARLLLRVRELPRQLSVEELAELFEGRTAFVERLAALDDPLGHAREVAATLTDAEKKEVLDAHPAIGERKQLSKHSAAEQGADYDPAVIAELDGAERALRGALRLPLRRLRQPPAQARARPDPARAPRAARASRSSTPRSTS